MEETKQYAPHQQRVVDEKAALEEKTTKLLAFMQTATFGSLDKVDANLLQEQHQIMQQYINILDQRINRF